MKHPTVLPHTYREDPTRLTQMGSNNMAPICADSVMGKAVGFDSAVDAAGSSTQTGIVSRRVSHPGRPSRLRVFAPHTGSTLCFCPVCKPPAPDRAARDGAVPKINYREYLETFSREWNDRASQGRSAALLQEARRVLGYFVNRAVEGEDGKRWRADDADYSYVTTHGVVRAAGAVYDAIGAFLLSHADQTQEGGK